jgi:DNA-binding response OmpR family regulator
VILVSGYPHTLETIRHGHLRAGAAFRKPVDPTALLAVIQQHVRRSTLDRAAWKGP